MYKDALGKEIKVGQLVAVGRYGRRSCLDVGIVYAIEKKKSSWIKFREGTMGWNRKYADSRAEVHSGINSNIIIVDLNGRDMSGPIKELKSEGHLPATFRFGEAVDQEISSNDDKDSKVVKAKTEKSASIFSDSILDALGPPTGLSEKK